MGKKKLAASSAVATIPVYDAETISQANRERARKAADAEYDKALSTASADYTAGMEAAWRKYVIALKADPTKPGDKLWGHERDYDRQFDEDRATALKRWETVTNAAAKKLERTEAH